MLSLSIGVLMDVPPLDCLARGLVSYIVGYFFVKLWNEFIVMGKKIDDDVTSITQIENPTEASQDKETDEDTPNVA